MGSAISRKYCELIFTSANKYPNWDPPKRIEAGDFGFVNKETGELMIHGNVYTDPEILGKFPSLKEDCPVALGEREDVKVVCSTNGQSINSAANPEIDLGNVANASFSGAWRFEKSRGALLVMMNPQMTYIPRSHILGKLAEIHRFRKPKVVLVTAVFNAPSYAMFASATGGSDVSMELNGTVPALHAPGATAGVAVESGWNSKYTSGLYRAAGGVGGSDRYTPLFVLEKIKTLRRGERFIIPERGEDIWTTAIPPWDALDEEGNEIEEEYSDVEKE
ncbi:hypothetical protein FRB97_001117 [Tulasnella sp. 331]|nr:hypothetical protein FRB97_001117 [Tulasnella sp. 331]